MKKNMKLGDVWRSCNKVRAAIFRFPLNIWEYFKPQDPSNTGLVSESTFVGILSGQLRSQIGLSDPEIRDLADYFRVQDGRILYSQFCEIIHGNEPKLAEKPTITGLEWQDPDHINPLSRTELRKLKLIITQIAININKRKLVLRPYFQDYELIAKNSGNVTITHFARILSFLGIVIAPEEFSLLVKRFGKHGYTINYVAFVQELEDAQNFMDEHGMLHVSGDLMDQFPGRIITAELPKLPRPEVGNVSVGDAFGKETVFHPVLERKKDNMPIVEIINRIQRLVLERRLRVKNFFTHFDVLNSGKVSTCQFRRALDSMQLSSLGKLYLTENEISQLTSLYQDPNDCERVFWKVFEDDINHVFTTNELEKLPNLRIDPPPQEILELPRKGQKDWKQVSNNSRDICEEIIIKIRHRVNERKLILKMFFKDYDKLNHGHVSRNQLRQILGTAAILLAREEIFALEQRYNDDSGFNYGKFIEDLEAAPVTVPLYVDMLEEKRRINSPQQPLPKPCQDERDISLILAKIKAKVLGERIKVTEFLRTFDRHNEMSISRSRFVRGVDQLRCSLTPTEIETIMEVFKAPLRPGYVEYERFGNAVEEAVTIGSLEKSPLTVPCQHVASATTPKSFLNFEERQIVTVVMDKLAGIYSPNFIDIFKDFDKTNIGTVTKEQLMKVLSVRKALALMSTSQFDTLYKCFTIERYNRLDFDYRAFLRALDLLKNNK